MLNTKHLFNSAVAITIITLAIYAWLRGYKAASQGHKKRFIIETLIIFIPLIILNYFITTPSYCDYYATELTVRYYQWSSIITTSCTGLVIYLQAKYLYNKISFVQRTHLLYEYGIALIIFAILGYCLSSDAPSLILCGRLIGWTFFWTLLYASIRNWICLKMAARKNRGEEL